VELIDTNKVLKNFWQKQKDIVKLESEIIKELKNEK
jgi:hypothetical protein